MKKYGLLLFTFLLFAFASQAQDIITLTNGNTIQAKVLQINPTEITYKDFNNQDGPTITIMKAGVVSIAYANGTKTTFTDADRASSGSFTRSSSSGRNGDQSRGYFKKKSSGYGKVHGWYFGVGLSEGGTSIASSDPTYSAGGGVYSGLSILATKMFNQHLGLQFGIGGDGYSYNVNYNASNIFADQSDEYAQSYITIPVRLLYLSNTKTRVGFYANAGIDFSILEAASDQEGDNLNSYYSSVLISPYISCGVDLRNSSARGIWMLGPFFKTTLPNVYSGSQYQYYGETYMNSGNSGNFSSFGITLSYMAHFGR